MHSPLELIGGRTSQGAQLPQLTAGEVIETQIYFLSALCIQRSGCIVNNLSKQVQLVKICLFEIGVSPILWSYYFYSKNKKVKHTTVMAAVYLCSDLIASRLCYNPNGTHELWHFIKHYLHRVN